MASIIERRGKFCVVVNYTDQKGKRRQKWSTFDTKKEAQVYAAKMEYSKAAGLSVFLPTSKTVEDLMKDFVENYGRDKWSHSNYQRCVSIIRNYINPHIGKMKLTDISPRWIESYYHTLLQQDSIKPAAKGENKKRQVSTSTVRSIHKLLRCAFGQAERWELISSNPFSKAMAPRHKEKPRDIWEVDDLKKALAACDDPVLELCINLAFSCSLRLGEILGLTWTNVHIDEDLIESNAAWIYIDRQLQRVSADAYDSLNDNSVFLTFPVNKVDITTRLVLKEPKTASSVRKIYLPRTMALLLQERRARIDEIKDFLGDDYNDFDLVVCHDNGTPIEHGRIRTKFQDLIKKVNLKPVVFHSLRHSSTTYKLKVSGGDIKAVQGDTGHAEAAMITERYAHILDDDRRINAEKFEEMFYQDEDKEAGSGSNDELLALMKKLQESPELLQLLKGLVK